MSRVGLHCSRLIFYILPPSAMKDAFPRCKQTATTARSCSLRRSCESGASAAAPLRLTSAIQRVCGQCPRCKNSMISGYEQHDITKTHMMRISANLAGSSSSTLPQFRREAPTADQLERSRRLNSEGLEARQLHTARCLIAVLGVGVWTKFLKPISDGGGGEDFSEWLLCREL